MEWAIVYKEELRKNIRKIGNFRKGEGEERAAEWRKILEELWKGFRDV